MLCVNVWEVGGREHSSGALEKDLAVTVLFVHSFCRHIVMMEAGSP